MGIGLRSQGALGIRDGHLRRAAWRGHAEQQQAKGGAPGGQGILAVGLGIDRGIPPLAIRLAPAPEVEDDGLLPGGQGGGQRLRDQDQDLLRGPEINVAGPRGGDGVVAGGVAGARSTRLRER